MDLLQSVLVKFDSLVEAHDTPHGTKNYVFVQFNLILIFQSHRTVSSTACANVCSSKSSTAF